MTVELQLLGGFAVRRDGAPLPPFPRRDAAALVKLLALAPGHRLGCERAADALWPDLPLEEARPRLHKAAHFARRVLGEQDAVTVHANRVALLPHAPVEVDVERFETAAAAALAAADPAACADAARLCPGALLPEDETEPWTAQARERVHRRRLAVLRAAGRWDDVLELEPADEEAHLALLRAAVDAGDRAGALRRHDALARALAEGPGVAPGAEADALRARALGTGAPAPAPERPPHLEREVELARLRSVVDTTVATGRGAVVLVGSEAGSGKTALVAELAARVGDRARVLRSGCDDLLAPRSLGPFRDVARAVGGPLADAFAAGGDPEAVLPALLRLLTGAPTLLVVEDLHWADDATVDAVRFLARRVPELPAVLVLTCREDELGRTHPVRRLLGALSGPGLRRIAVRPLSVEAVAVLADGRTDPRRLHRVTRGNAFYVTEVLAAGGGVPVTVRDAVLARLATLSEPAQDLIQRLAVVPTRVDRGLADHLTRDRPGPLLEAERAGVLAGDAGSLWFRHEIARAAVLSTLTPGELVTAHRDVLEALLREPAPDLARVVHHAQAGRRPDVLVRYGPAAADDAVRAGAYRQAADTLQVVIDAGAGLEPARRARLLADRASYLYYLNLFEQAFRCATRAVTAAEAAGDPLLLADAHVVLSKTAYWARGPLFAERAAARAVTLLEGSGDDLRRAAALAGLARALSNLGTPGVVAEPGGGSARFAEQALALAERAGSVELRCQALFYVGSGRLAEGDERGVADLALSVELATGDPHLELGVRACVNAAGGSYRAGRYADAEHYVTLGLRLAEHSEFFSGDYRLRLTRAAVRASAGRWEEAVRELRELLAVPGAPAAMGLHARSLLARLLARRGSAEAADVLAAATWPDEARDEVSVTGPLAAAAVEVAWLRGDVGAMPALAADVLAARPASGARGSRAELSRYLQRAGHPVAVPADPIGPWAPALAGRPLEAAAAWAALGERYEEALERALSGDPAQHERGLAVLDELGAVATVAALRRQPLLVGGSPCASCASA
ncbi:ATP-binding protein [Blastococcus sp. SYSU D00669]